MKTAALVVGVMMMAAAAVPCDHSLSADLACETARMLIYQAATPINTTRKVFGVAATAAPDWAAIRSRCLAARKFNTDQARKAPNNMRSACLPLASKWASAQTLTARTMG